VGQVLRDTECLCILQNTHTIRVKNSRPGLTTEAGDRL